MFNNSGLNKHERRKQNIAFACMLIFCVPILYIYLRFFSNAFFTSDGNFTFENFTFLFQSIRLGQADIQSVEIPLRNTIIFTVIVTILEVVFSCMAGYALARMNFKGKQSISFMLMVLRMFPGVLLLIGILYILLYLQVLNTLFGVIIVAIALRLPGSTFIIRNFFLGIPRDIENSALVDGCTKMSAFFQVIIHLVKPGISSISIFSFMAAWSNYLLFNVLILNSKTPVFATYLRQLSLQGQMIADYNLFAAMSIIYILPVLVFFLISQKQLMKGNVSGGKGI